MIQRFDAFVSGITVCYKYIQKIKSMEMEGFGLKGAHVMCLCYLHGNPDGLTAAQLSALCAEDKAAISRTISELRSQGYVSSVSVKNYRAPLFLTESGQALYQKMLPIIENWVSAGGVGLDDAQRAQFYSGLSLIAENLKTKIETNFE